MNGFYNVNGMEHFVYQQDNYAFTQDFIWYVTVLVDLTFVSGVSKAIAQQLSEQLLDVVVRVPAVRPLAVKAMVC